MTGDNIKLEAYGRKTFLITLAFLKIQTSSDVKFIGGQDLGIYLRADDKFMDDDLGKMIIYQSNIICKSLPFCPITLWKRFKSKMKAECGNEGG